MIALLLAAALVPVSADAVINVEDVSGLRALFTAAATHAPSLAPAQLGVSLRNSVGVDLFAADPGWGLSRRGARQLVYSGRSAGLSAPVADAKAAKTALTAWLNAAPNRAGRIASGRLFTASGGEATSLLTAMSRATPLPRDLGARATGPAWVWLRLAPPLRAAVLAIDASAGGLVAHGVATGDSPILAGRAPGCEGGVACLAAGIGPAGRSTVQTLLAQLGLAPQPELRSARNVAELVDRIDARQLSERGSLASALQVSPVFDAPPAGAAALVARIDLEQVDAALLKLTPLDALRGSLAGGAFALHLVYGALLRNAGPLTLTGNPSPGNAAEIELRLPVR